MRRTDREITDRAEMLAIMEKCQVCRLALRNGDYPYILPVNFGMEEKDGQLVLYFHGAAEGTKYDLMAADPRASFEMDCETVQDKVQRAAPLRHDKRQENIYHDRFRT